MKYVYLFMLLLFIGCNVSNESQNEAAGVSFNVKNDSYFLGSTVTAVLENNSDQPITYNLCFTKVEQKQDKKWQSVGPSVACTAIAKILKPGQKENYRIVLDDNLLPGISEGRYRLETKVGLADREKQVSLTSPSFYVNATVRQ